MKPRAIHQFHSGSAYGDGVTNGMFFIQKVLRESGYRSEIYCVHVDPRLRCRIHHFQDYEDSADDLLLVHYSLGTDHDLFITNLNSPAVLIYHNITPAHFFPEGSGTRVLIESGRRQLAQWAIDRHFVGAIADSEFNAEELASWGYSPIASIGLLVDLDRLRSHVWNADVANEIKDARNLLFVGRICEHKGQIALAQMMARLRAIVNVPVRLLLAGATELDTYEAELRETIGRLGLTSSVVVLGKRDDEDIYALYRFADLYVSLSQHEGFGMPFVEAMAFDLPILAIDAGGVTTTLDTGGLLLESANPDLMAAAAKLMLQEPSLRRQVIEGQRKSLARHERPVLVSAFETFLREIGFDVTFNSVQRNPPLTRHQWSVEGPFDSSYSLAIVNRELARALDRAGEDVALISRDGPGTFAPNDAFLRANQEIAGMFERGRDGTFPDVCLRNQFPPHVMDMRGTLRVLANYAWEESGFPGDWVPEFNASLDLITVTSSYVAKVLRDNGVHVPIGIVGNGIDQILECSDSSSVPCDRHGPFRFLHISSGFPRKGLDILLAAWAAAFAKTDDVELVVKTFANVHNTIEVDLDEYLKRNPHSAPITLINGDLDPRAVRKLYTCADALVFPSRGEGFGLPIAEAMALEKPVITTAYGGQTDFCTTDTAWLCDYTFAYAKTHMSLFDSVWVEPDLMSLTRTLRELFEASIDERTRRTESGRALIRSRYTWDQVAQRTRDAVGAVRRSPSADGLRLPTIGLVSTWNSRCGIAAYAQSLVRGIESERLHVFANKVDEILQPDEGFVRRCWNAGWEDPLDELLQEIIAANVDAVVLQFNFGFFRLQTLKCLIDRLHARGVVTFMILHSTADVIRPDITVRLADIHLTLATVCRLLVHSVHDLNRLKTIGLVDNVALFPMGLPQPFIGNRAAVRQSLGLEGNTVIASFGYLLPHKGLRELIGAFALLRAKVPRAHLLLLNALYPITESTEELRACQKEIRRLRIGDSVTLVTDFLEEGEVVTRLAAADILVYPYQRTQESASAAVKIGLASLTPIAVTPLQIFADIAAVSHTLPGTTSADIADGLTTLLADPPATSALAGRQEAWVAAHAWPNLWSRLDGLIRGELREDNRAALRATERSPHSLS
jgi:glycosyltransferase involved in cell wall biosynthesis